MRSKDHWNKVYSDKPADAVTWYQARPELSLDLIARTGLPLDARIIDVGGGASTLVDHLLAAGYGRLEVLDIAEQALARSKERLGARSGEVTWRVADVTSWSPPALYDLWHDRAVFHFLTRAPDRRAYADVLARAVKPGGHAIIAIFALDGPEKCSGLPVERYDEEKLRGEIGAAFELIGAARERHLSPGGMSQAFTYFRLRHR